MSLTFAHLTTSPTRLLVSKEEPPKLNTESTQQQAISERTPFLISHLPYELRQQIYIFYFASLNLVPITNVTVHLQHHSLTPLSLSSLYLAYDPSPLLYYRNATFSFTCPEALKSFALSLTRGASPAGSSKKQDSESSKRKSHLASEVRKVRILYGQYNGVQARDWVHILMSNFPRVNYVCFGVEGTGLHQRDTHGCFGDWWGCIRDAVREGLSIQSEEKGGKGRIVRLRVEDGEWGVEEVVCC